MVLDHDCVRAILLEVEQCPFNQSLNVDKLAEKLPEFNEETIWYACLKMSEGGLLEVETSPPHMSYYPSIDRIICMTYNGHEFLDTIREKTVWEKAMSALKKGGGSSLKLLGKIAGDVIQTVAVEAIKSL